MNNKLLIEVKQLTDKNNELLTKIENLESKIYEQNEKILNFQNIRNNLEQQNKNDEEKSE